MLRSNEYYTNNHITRNILRNHNSNVRGLADWYNPIEWKFLLDLPMSKILKAKLNLLVQVYEQRLQLQQAQYKRDVNKSKLRLVA